jgi:ATP-binding cassette subfamily B protein
MNSQKQNPNITFRMLKVLQPYWRSFACVCFFGLVIAVIEIFPPKLIGDAIDMMSSGHFEMKQVYELAGIWFAIVMSVQLINGWQISIADWAGGRALNDLRMKVFAHLQKLSMSYFHRTHYGRIITTISSDLDSIRDVLVWGLNTVSANFMMMVMATVMICKTDIRLFWATVWLVPIMTFLSARFGSRITRAWQKVRHHSSKVGSNQAENIAGVKVVAAFNRQKENLEEYNDLQRKNTHFNVWASRQSGAVQPLFQLVRFIGLAIILAYGGFLVAEKQLPPGKLVSILLYWEWFMQPAINFGSFFNEFLIAASGIERVFEILDEEPEIQDLPDATPLPKLRGDIEFENVGFSYQPNGNPILKDVSFSIPAGSTVAVVGETGSGKSTIISLLARFYLPSKGRVLLDGHDLRKSQQASLQEQMAMVLQTNFLFNGTVMENLKYARPNSTDEEIYEAARKLDCHDRFLSLKNGYHTNVGEKGSALSVGERQLVCFTRALVADPRLLLLDEATSALDPLTGFQVQQALKSLAKGRTTFIVTHRLSTTLSADRVLVIENGHVIENGKPQDLLARKGKYWQLYNSGNSYRKRAAQTGFTERLA